MTSPAQGGADSGGSNAARARAWKVELARLAAETEREDTCYHYPPGTSKWNKIEHRCSRRSPGTGAADR